MMRRFSTTEAKQRFAELLDVAQREPVTICRPKRDVAVVISRQRYDRLHRANIAELQRFCDRIGARAKRRGLTAEKLQKLLAEDG
jgi:prevent-host-death family protein